MTVQAKWHIEDLALDEADPFADEVDVVAKGISIDLRNPESLNRALGELLSREAELWKQGTRCIVKQKLTGEHRDGVTCSACPIRHESMDDPMTDLCDVGREQERVLTMLEVHTHRPDAVERAR